MLPLTVLNSHLVAHNATSDTAARRTYEVIMGAFARYESVWLMRRPDLSINLQLKLAESRFPVRHLAISLFICLFAPATVQVGACACWRASSHYDCTAWSCRVQPGHSSTVFCIGPARSSGQSGGHVCDGGAAWAATCIWDEAPNQILRKDEDVANVLLKAQAATLKCRHALCDCC